MRALIQIVVILGAVLCVDRSQAQLLDQGASSAVRVTVAQNQDGSRTTYRYDNENRKALATTRSMEGKVMSTIRYDVDELGRFSAGQVFDAKNQLQFKTEYKYGTSGQLLQETQLTPDGKIRHRLVYSYNEAGKQTGYEVYDGAGNLLTHTTNPTLGAPAAAIPQKPKRK